MPGRIRHKHGSTAASKSGGGHTKGRTTGKGHGHGGDSFACMEMLCKAFEMAPHIVLVFGRDRFLFVNSHFEKVSGYRREDICQAGFDQFSIFAPEDRRGIRSEIRGVLRGRRQPAREVRILTEDGQILFCTLTTRHITVGHAEAVLATLTDITAEKRAVRDILKAKDKYQDYLDALPILVAVLDSSGRILVANSMAAKTLGSGRHRLVGLDLASSFLSPESAAAFRERMSGANNGSAAAEMHLYTLIAEDGSSRQVYLHLSPLRSSDERVAGWVVSGLDAGREMALRDHVESVERKYMSLFRQIPIGIYRTTPDGRVLIANPAMVRMAGYSSFEELAAAGIKEDSFHPDTPRKAFLEAVESKGRVRNFESRWVRPDGTTICVRETAWAVRDDDGKTLYYDGIVEDITEQTTARSDLDWQMEFERLVTGIALLFMSAEPSAADSVITESLKQIGEFLDLDRGYVFLYRDNMLFQDNTHEWTREGVEPQKDRLQNLRAEDFCWSNAQIRDERIIAIPRVSDLPPEAAMEKAEFEREAIKSLIMVPMVVGKDILGFLGFDSVRTEREWPERVTNLLSLVAEVLGNAIVRRRQQVLLLRRLEIEKAIISASMRLINVAPESLDGALASSLAEIGGVMQADGAAILKFAGPGLDMETVQAWARDECAQAAGQAVSTLSKLNQESRGSLAAGRILRSSRRNPQPGILDASAGFGAACNVICIPFAGGREKFCIAFLSMADSPPWGEWGEEEESLLRIFSEMLGGVFERVGTARELQKERALFTTLMDNIPDHIYFKDSQSRFIRVNRAMYRDHGFERQEDVIGKTDFDLFTEEHARQAYADEQEIVRGGEPMVGKEEKETWPDGSVTWVSSTKLPLYDQDGRIVGTFGVSRDVTERKCAEEERRKLELQMQHAQRLESLGVLSGGIAHDFNNLLMGILGNLSLALGHVTQESPGWSNIKQAETAALRAAELTNQMLAYSGRSKPDFKPLNLTKLVREMSHLLEVSISKKIELRREFQDPIPLVDGDAAQIRQVIMNLITNASDAIGDRKGTITIKTALTDCSKSYLAGCYINDNLPAGPYVFLEVSDTGCGMDAKTMERMFDPFFTTKVRGRGLGLAAVLGIVRAHKGTLKVYSEPGRGTTFRVLFPCSASGFESEESGREEEKPWRGEGLVLVVDDDEIIRGVSEQLLRKAGFDTICAPDGKSALETIRQKAGSLAAMLVDVTLPEMSGQELIERIRAIDCKTPVVLMSGYNEQTATENMKPGLYQAFVQKPFNMQALATAMKDAMKPAGS